MIDIEEYSIPTPEEKSEIRSMLNIPLNKRVLLFTGRLFEGKGIDLLLDAYDKLQLKYSDVHLLVVGAVSENNPENNKYVKQIRADNYYGGTCTLVLNQVNVSVYFKAADIFVFPTYSEGCPVVQLEAMATGLICVASDLEPIKEKIIDGVTGYTFVSGNSCDLQEKLELALRRVGNKDFALKIREAVYEKYSIAHVIARWETHITDYWLRTNYGVVIHTPWAYPRIGGIQKISFETAKGLTSQGFKVTIVTRIHDKSLSVRETVDGIRIVRLSYVPYLMHVQLVFFLIKEWNNFRHLSIWGAYGDFITFPTMLLATVVKLLGKKVSIRLSNQLMENKTYAEKVII